MERKKTYIEEMDRSIYDIADKERAGYKVRSGLNEDIVREISRQKNEPKWMLEARLESLKYYNELPMPTWGPDLDKVDINEIITYISPDTEQKEDWKDLPEEIVETFDRLGIQDAEKYFLGGVGAQYDSEVVYHSIKESLKEQGVIYMDMDLAVKEHEDIVKKHFMKLLPSNDHIYNALHGAVWSGGSFVYVPPGVKVDIPLQSYFRFNAPGAGQFEHTLIVVDKGASVHFIEGCSAPRYNVVNLHAGCVELFVEEDGYLRYSTVENWSKNMYNLNSKRATVGKNGEIEWVSGTFGSEVTMLYPSSFLKGEGARSKFTSVSFAGEGQTLDTGTKVIHGAANTSSTIETKSISKNGGKAIYRSSVTILPEAENSKSTASCESLMLDNISQSDTLPVMDIRNSTADVGHEAKVGKISEEAIYYLMSRGLSEEKAKEMIVRGFVEPITKELPLEYAVEMNNLISLELEGSIG